MPCQDDSSDRQPGEFRTVRRISCHDPHSHVQTELDVGQRQRMLADLIDHACAELRVRLVRRARQTCRSLVVEQHRGPHARERGEIGEQPVDGRRDPEVSGRPVAFRNGEAGLPTGSVLFPAPGIAYRFTRRRIGIGCVGAHGRVVPAVSIVTPRLSTFNSKRCDSPFAPVSRTSTHPTLLLRFGSAVIVAFHCPLISAAISAFVCGNVPLPASSRTTPPVSPVVAACSPICDAAFRKFLLIASFPIRPVSSPIAFTSAIAEGLPPPVTLNSGVSTPSTLLSGRARTDRFSPNAVLPSRMSVA